MKQRSLWHPSSRRPVAANVSRPGLLREVEARMKTWQVFSKVSARSLLMAYAVLAGCATYTTPGPGVSIANLSRADADIGELLKAEPASPFPARMAVARIQA